MNNLCIRFTFLLLFSTCSAKIILTSQLFRVAGDMKPSVKLSWFNASDAKIYYIYRGVNGGEFQYITSASGNTYDDYEVPSGKITYAITGGTDDSTDTVNISTVFLDAHNKMTWKILSPHFEEQTNLLNFDNIQDSLFQTISRIHLDGKYYQYSVQRDEGGTSKIVEVTSSNGVDFTGQTRVVLPGKVICAGGKDGCKLERVTFFQNPKNLEVVMWAHWEYRAGYAQARVAVAFGMPGGLWKFGGAFRPLGHDSRDLTFFQDDDGAGYILSSTSMNMNMNIYKLSSDLHNVTSLVTTVLKGQRREAPSLMKHEGFYYLFTSQASGWYPSLGQYISAINLAGPWSESRNIGNLAGFGAQSGTVRKLGESFVMIQDQWKAQWRHPEPPNRAIILPISLKKGWAQFYFYERLSYLDDDQLGGVYGVQSGKILTGMTNSIPGALRLNSESSPSSLTSLAINLDPKRYAKYTTVPFTYSVDLGKDYFLTEFDLTTKLVGGSETAYQFTISGSKVASDSYELIVDRRNNTRVGFVTSIVQSLNSAYRYVNLEVLRVINVQNNKEVNWNLGIHEFTIYGQPAEN